MNTTTNPDTNPANFSDDEADAQINRAIEEASSEATAKHLKLVDIMINRADGDLAFMREQMIEDAKFAIRKLQDFIANVQDGRVYSSNPMANSAAEGLPGKVAEYQARVEAKRAMQALRAAVEVA